MQDLHFATIRSGEFLIRELVASDLESLAAYHQIPEVVQFRKWSYRKSHEHDRLVAAELEIAKTFPKRHGFVLGLEHRASAQLLGDCVLCIEPHDRRQVELDFTLPVSAPSLTLALGATCFLLQHLFTTLRKHRVKVPAHVDNQCLNEFCNLLKLRHEGRLRENFCYQGSWADENLYAVLAKEWRRGQ